MNNYRPLLIFGATLLVIIGGFWSVLTFASSYNHRLAQSAQPSNEIAQKPAKPTEPKTAQTTPKPNDTKKPTNQEQPKAQNPTPQSKTPPAVAPKSTPSTTPAPTTGANPTPTHVPKAGADELNAILTAIGIGLAIVLLARLRRQTIALRP